MINDVSIKFSGEAETISDVDNNLFAAKIRIIDPSITPKKIL